MTAHPAARSLARLALVGLVAAGLGGCWGPREGILATGSSEPALAQGEPTLLVATTRRPVAGGQKPWFSGERGRGLSFARARMAGPSDSLVQRVTSVVTGDWSVARVDTPQSERAAETFAETAVGKDVLLYVHGYRETFETAAVSAMELSRGIGFRGATGLFTWPSGGATFDYAYDRESALWSRDALEDLLTALARSPSGGRVHVVAHSMGSFLTIETLRNVRAAGGEAAMAKIASVTLASPDVDIDQFVRAVERLGPDARKITVITSVNDRALELSRRLAGGVARAGAADREKLAGLEALGVRIADASEFGSGLINHDLFLTNPEVKAVVKRAVERAG
ncbi:alpha/beta hydrolase [Salinarimonas soli]|uniref:Alpha/beta hydrolase n=1 Tax=Salinarimonas soli TaxID=1638099 RepID=A0A5B2VEF3_9HYPH|nr:alpha/beta hydrolase [Salinarimonas soli]KAA2237354.1 alpha/beta hydrolase [Salinarimonas soli]